MAAARVIECAHVGPSALADAVRAAGAPCVLRGLSWPALDRLGWTTGSVDATERMLGHARIALRDARAVERSGGAFATARSARADELAASAALAFSTSYDDELVRRLKPALDQPPTALRPTASRPIVSVGGSGLGLGFHQHDESWLYLVCGRKRWGFGAPERSSLRGRRLAADQRAAADELPAADADVRCEQRPGEVVVVPRGWWHATRNCEEERLTLGLGGLGPSPGLHFAAARGQLPELHAAADARLLARAADGLARSLLHTAAEHGQLDVARELDWRETRAGGAAARSGAGEAWLHAARDAAGATPLHWAAGGGGCAGLDAAARTCEWLLLAHPRAVRATDRWGTTALHWVARTGDVRTAQLLVRAGADPDAQDARGCRLAHLAAAEGHVPLLRWLAGTAAADVRAPDGAGRTPLEWAVASGARDTADWLTANGVAPARVAG